MELWEKEKLKKRGKCVEKRSWRWVNEGIWRGKKKKRKEWEKLWGLWVGLKPSFQKIWAWGRWERSAPETRCRTSGIGAQYANLQV
ncbi:hypothetical protein KY285_024034 [Solanum tuberosum]|nr:hypothetical protein KY285_024034 [Solanum tuberosum]